MANKKNETDIQLYIYIQILHLKPTIFNKKILIDQIIFIESIVRSDQTTKL